MEHQNNIPTYEEQEQKPFEDGLSLDEISDGFERESRRYMHSLEI